MTEKEFSKELEKIRYRVAEEFDKLEDPEPLEYEYMLIKAGQEKEREQYRNKDEYTDYEKRIIKQARQGERKKVLEEAFEKQDKIIRYSKMLTNNDYKRGFEDAKKLILDVLEALKKES